MRGILVLLAVCLVGCGGPAWRDVPTGTWDPRAYDHNVRVCREQGLRFDAVKQECVP